MTSNLLPAITDHPFIHSCLTGTDDERTCKCVQCGGAYRDHRERYAVIDGKDGKRVEARA